MMKKVRYVSQAVTAGGYTRGYKIHTDDTKFIESANAALLRGRGKNLAKYGLELPKGRVLENLGKYAAKLTDPNSPENSFWKTRGTNRFDATTLEAIFENEGNLEIEYPAFAEFTEAKRVAFGVLGAWVLYSHKVETAKYHGMTKFEWEVMLEFAYSEKRNREQLAWEKANGITEETKAADRQLLGFLDEEVGESK